MSALARAPADGAMLVLPLREALADPAGWAALADRSIETSVFSGPAMVRAAAGRIEPADWTVVAVPGNDGSLDALAVVRRTRLAPLVGRPIVDGWWSHYGPHTPPLIGPAPDAASRLLRGLAGIAPVVRLHFQMVDGPAMSALGEAVAATGGRLFLTDIHERAALDATLPAEEAFGPQLAGKRLREFRRGYRKLTEMDGFTRDVLTRPDEVANGLADFARLEAASWRGAAGTALAGHPARLDFARDFSAALAGEGRFRCDRLRIGDRTIAVLLTLLDGERAAFWKVAHDLSHAALSPGGQVMRLVSEDMLADPGVRLVDSLASPDHPLMGRLWAGRIRIATVFLAVDAAAVPLAEAAVAQHEQVGRLKDTARRWRDRLFR